LAADLSWELAILDIVHGFYLNRVEQAQETLAGLNPESVAR
jgi:hypothetical protein